ncbi:3-hydroxyacyl-CoA dehydrogenase family protein [Nesterenkonia aerolata]|uniref:3-hydroxyacyl-CoA dehydrogenase family protein n=1 Tax=Nesterenkonia aerolata TaxID=3074079 RepID=A0ABU2DPL7_9MICC|nr:3-hydroxyacyl-CoA dehydrogenase family protein [Nesterenkonia sp. LY-0111]MDR8018455.1 3-hydroxyacyl-CoA dehydrogenase family protein [Nesterenkonia sp. LY-0111]
MTSTPEEPVTSADQPPLAGVRHISVIGAGTMGSQIAMVCALAGYRVTLVDLSDSQLQSAREQLQSRMDRDVARGRRRHEDVEQAMRRLATSCDRAEAVVDSDVVIEAAAESLKIKKQLFAALDREAPARAILATNSSNIVSSRLAEVVSRPERVVNLHFFNPALVMECVEVAPHDGTADHVIETSLALVESLGKSAVRLRREVPGFIANRLLSAIRREALELYDAGVADVADIDRAARTALRHPMGPFELMDLVGIDVAYMIRMAEYEQTGDENALPHPAITRLYESGDLGRKTGRGWYTYDDS